jgi:hypothetical protein
MELQSVVAFIDELALTASRGNIGSGYPLCLDRMYIFFEVHMSTLVHVVNPLVTVIASLSADINI